MCHDIVPIQNGECQSHESLFSPSSSKASPRRGRPKIWCLLALGPHPRHPLRTRRLGSFRAVSETKKQPTGNHSRPHGTNHRAQRGTLCCGARCRTGVNPLLFGQRGQLHPRRINDQSDPETSRPGYSRTQETPQVFLHPLPSRPTHRDLAIRFHPLAPRRRNRC